MAVCEKYTHRLYKSREEDELVDIQAVVNPEYKRDISSEFVFVVRKKDEKIKQDKLFIKDTS